MRVCAQHNAAGTDIACLCHDLMAGSGKLKILLYAVLPGPVAREFDDLRLLDARGRGVVVGDDNDLLRIPDLVAQHLDLFRDLYARAEDAIHHRAVDVRPDDIARRDAFLPGRAGEDLPGCCFPIRYPPIFKMPARYLTAGQAGVQSAKRQNGTYTSPSMIVRAVR